MSEKSVLIYEGKHGVLVWAVPTLEEEIRALRDMFNRLDHAGYYHGLSGAEARWYRAALEGDDKALRRFLLARRYLEYERWSIEALQEGPK